MLVLETAKLLDKYNESDNPKKIPVHLSYYETWKNKGRNS
jgi:hypothetical protein